MSEKQTDFEWSEAAPRRTGVVTAFLCGVAIASAAAVYAVQALQLAPASVAEKVTADFTADNPAPPQIGSVPTEKAVTIAEQDIKDRRDTTAVFAEPEAAPSGPAPSPAASEATTPTTHDAATDQNAPQQPTIINRDHGKPDAAQAEPAKPAAGAKAATDAPPQTTPKPRYREAERAPTPERQRPDYGPPVDPRGRGEGYWNGSDFN